MVKVNDGIESDPEAVVLKARTSYQVLSQWTAHDPTDPATFLRRTSAFVFERILKSTQPASHRLMLVKNHDKAQAVDTLTVNVVQTNATFWRLRYQEKKRQFTCVPDRFVEFRYRPADDPNFRARGLAVQSVAVAGSFNGWNASATPMTDEGDGTYVAYVKPDEGLHTYKFVVNGSLWLPDPKADPKLRVPDGHGGSTPPSSSESAGKISIHPRRAQSTSPP